MSRIRTLVEIQKANISGGVLEALLDFLSKEVAWIFPVLGWILGILVVFLVLIIPMYYVFLPFARRVTAKLSSYLQFLSERSDELLLARSKYLDNAAERFQEDRGLSSLKPSDSSSLLSLLRGLIKSVSKMQRSMSASVSSLLRLEKQFSIVKDKLEDSNSEEVDNVPTAVTPNKEIRVAWLTAVASSTVLLSLMIVNTGMLSQILSDLDIVPRQTTFIGIPLAYVFAFILTLVEAGLGIGHGAVQEAKSDRISIWGVVLVIFAFILANVEGFFYSQVASSRVFTFPFTSYDIPQSSLFYLWGFVLVMTLFALGFIAYRAYVVIVSGNEIRIQRALVTLYNRHLNALKKLEQNLNKSSAMLTGSSKERESVSRLLQDVKSSLEELEEKVPAWPSGSVERLTREDVLQLSLMGSIWLGLSLLGISAVTYTGLYCFDMLYPQLDSALIWVLSIAQALVSICIGFLLSTDMTIVNDKQNKRSVLVSSKYARIGGILLGCLLVGAYLIILFTTALAIEFGGIWFLNLLLCLFLAVAGFQLNPLMNVMSLSLLRLRNLVLRFAEALWHFIVWIFYIIFCILEWLFRLPALAMEKLISGRQREIPKTRENGV